MPKTDTEALYAQIQRRFVESGEWDRSATVALYITLHRRTDTYTQGYSMS